MAYEKSKVSSFGSRGLDAPPLVGFEYCHQFSRTPGEVPDPATLGEGEIAINLADGLLFIKSDSGDVIQVGGSGGGGANQVVSSGGISNLTSGQQEQIVTGTIVTTTDGRRWVYKGQGIKSSESSYIELADITPAWGVIADKPSTFTPSAHSHAISDVSGLQTALDGKQASGSYAAATHSHAIADVTGLQTALNSKQASGSYAAASHSHSVSDVSYLQTYLDARVSSAVPFTENHTSSRNSQYVIGDLVFRGGNIYRAIANNDGIVPQDNPSWESYWALVGSGYRNNIDIKDVSNYWLPPESPNDGDVLTFSSGAAAWIAAAPSGGGGGGLPGGTEGYILKYVSGSWAAAAPPTWRGDWDSQATYSVGDVAVYNSRLWRVVNGSVNYQPDYDPNYWAEIKPPNELPTSASTNDILSWNGSAWVAVMASTPGLPSGSQYDLLVYDGTNWVSQPAWGGSYSPLPSGSSDGDVLKWNSTTTDWVSGQPIADYSGSVGYIAGDLVSYNNTIWRAVSAGMGNAPSYGSGYWTNLSLIDNSPIASPSTPSDGDVLTYSSTSSAWVAAPPAGGATYLSGVVTTDIFADGLLEEVLILAPIVGNSTYLVEGLVVYRTMYNQQMRLYLSAYDEDGQAFLDHDKATADFANARTTVRRVDQMASETVEFESSGDQVVDVPIRFRALIQTANISSTSLVLRCGDSVDGHPCDILAGSWMVATKIA